jgi:hypothetical protein
MAREGYANFELPGIWGTGPFDLDSGNMRLHQAGTTNTLFSGSSDFGIGYRLGKITFEKFMGVPRHQIHAEGAMLGISTGRENERAVSKNGLKVMFEGDAAITKELWAKDLVSSIDVYDEEECQCFILPSESA